MSESNFWNDFLRKADLWAGAMHSGRVRDVFNALDALLQSHNLPYCFDVTTSNSGCLLIFSPEGDAAVAVAIDRLLAAAPLGGKWKILGRRQKKPLADAGAIVRSLYLIDPLEARFHTYRKNGIRFVDMFVPADADLSPEEGKGMINTFLWHALGEGFVMDRKIRGCVHLTGRHPRRTISARELVRTAREW